MGARTQSRSRAAARATEILRRIGAEVRTYRVAASLTLLRVGAAVGRSAAWVSRVERGLMPSVAVTELSQLAAAVGLRVWLSTFPDGPSLRDAAQVQLLQRFRSRVNAGWSWSLEVPVPFAGDARAADAVIRLGQAVVMIEAISRLADAQAQLRAIAIKARDMGIVRVVIVVAATHTNRSALRAAQPLLLDQFPLGTKATLRALAEVESPQPTASSSPDRLHGAVRTPAWPGFAVTANTVNLRPAPHHPAGFAVTANNGQLEARTPSNLTDFCA